MKKLILSFCLMLIAFSGFVQAQVYGPYVDTNKIWTTYWEYGAEGYPQYNYTYYVKFTGDTNLISNVYRKVMRSNDSAHITWFNFGYIRETVDKKIYYLLNSQDTVEKLIFDEGANVGDTLPIYYGSWSCPPYVVDSIDSVLIGDQYRKRYNPEENFWGTWIEGMGSLGGFDNIGVFQCWVGGIRTLLCFTENDTLKYSNPIYTFCYQGTLDINDQIKDKLSFIIFPNPAHDKLTITTTAPQKQTLISIYNMQGQQMMSATFQNQSTMQLDVSTLSKGIYIVKVQSEKSITNKKLIIQ